MMYTLTRDTYRYSKLIRTRATLLYDTNGRVYTRDTLDTWMYIEVQHYVLSVIMINTNRFQFFVPLPIIVSFFRFPSFSIIVLPISNLFLTLARFIDAFLHSIRRRYPALLSATLIASPLSVSFIRSSLISYEENNE